MSWDVSLMIDTGDKELVEVVDLGNYTYNVSPMYYKAFERKGGFRSLDGMRVKKAIPILERAIQRMKDDPKQYKKMNPENGWGDYEGALEYLMDILDGCKKHPKTIIKIY